MSTVAGGGGATSPRAWAAFACVAGIAAPLLYAAAVIVGGWATPGYNHLTNMISDLTGSGAPHRASLAVAFVIYNLLIAVFAASLPVLLPRARRPWISLAALTLLAVVAAGIGMVTFFPADPLSAEVSPAGWVHIVLAAVASFGTMLVIVIVGWSLRTLPGWRSFAAFSALALAVLALSGLWTASAAARSLPLVGVGERITIGAFMVWIFVLAVKLAIDARARLR